MRLVAVLLAVLSLAPACRRRGASGLDEERVRERATQVLEPVKKKFAHAIEATTKVGAERALDRCQLSESMIREAAPIAGTTVTRTSTRLRNAANAAPDWARATLDEFTTDGAPEGKWRAFSLGEGRTGYAEAMVISESCMACHGNTLRPEVEHALNEKYGGDGARGYAVGQFRGLYLVELPPEPK